MQVKLTCATLGSFDKGEAAAVIDAAIVEALDDLDDRGADGKDRVVQVLLHLKRGDNGHGDVVGHVEAAAKLPARRTRGTVCEIKNTSGQPFLQFNDLDRDDPRQRTIDELADGEVND